MKNADQINAFIRQEKYTEALELLKPQLNTSSEELSIRSTMAHCFYRLGQFEESVEQLTKALPLAPAQGQLFSERGIAYFMMGNRPASLQDFNKAQELEPENPYRYSSRAYVKDAFGDTKGAIAEYNNLGLLLEKVGYQKEAQQHFAKADELEGRKPADLAPSIAQVSPAPQQKPVSPPQQKQALTARYYGSTIKRIFTTREGFQEFLQFWLGRKSGR
jgi:tetratricopeptide (TPR) repeat protein